VDRCESREPSVPEVTDDRSPEADARRVYDPRESLDMPAVTMV
jgi:hypothetical protein